MQYYTTDPNDGSIAASADFRFSDDCLETERAIVRGYDGKLYFSDECPVKPDELARKERRAAFDAAISARLAAFAAERGWDSLDRVLGQTGAFAADAQVAQAAYDSTWQVAFGLIPQVEAGELSVEAAVAQLPPLVWPE